MPDIIYDPNQAPLPEAREIWDLGRRDEALALFLTARKKQKNNIAASLAAARALGASYRHREAENILRPLIAKARSIPPLTLLIGQVLREIHRPVEAQKMFRDAVKNLDHSPDSVIEYAASLDRAGFPKKALALLSKFYEKSPASPIFKLHEARLQAALGNKKEARAILENLLAQKKSITPGIYTTACSVLARLIDHDDPQRARELQTKTHELTRLGIARMLEQGKVAAKKSATLGRELTAESLQKFREKRQALGEEKVLFLLGFARSGTTLLEKLLARGGNFADAEELDLYGLYIHPYLVGTLEKYERDDELAEKTVEALRERYLKGMAEYFGGAPTNWLLDKNPSNTLICASIGRVFPEGKFLTMLRDPRDIILSAWFQHLPVNPENAAFRDWNNLVDRFHVTMSAWLDFREKMPPESWHEVRYENLVRDPKTELKAIGDWLGEEIKENASATFGHVSSPSHADVRHAIHENQVQRWKRHQELFDAKTRDILEPLMADLGYEW